MSKSIQLKLPVRSKPSKDSFDIRSRKVEPWIKTLPMVNLGETARLIFATLTETNRLKYSYHDRYQFLELLREPLQYVIDSMKKHFVGVTFPLSEKNYKVAIAAREILIAMDTAYKIAIEDLLENNILFVDKKLLSVLVYRATTYSSQVLLTSYQIYTPPTQKTWQELHRLYRFAEKRKIHKLSVFDEQRQYIKKNTITDEYLRTLLLSLTSPYHLRLGEVGKVNNTLERWTSHCSLNSFNHEKQKTNKGNFLVNLDNDVPPCSLSVLAMDSNNKVSYDARIIDASQLANILRDEIKKTENVATTTITGIDMSLPSLSHNLLKRLLIAWGVIGKRSFPRNEKQEEVQITLGLSATHEFINHRHGKKKANINSTVKKDAFNNRSQYNSTEVHALNDSQPDIWDMVYPNSETSNYEYPVAQEKTPLTQNKSSSSNKPQKDIYQVDDWVILNESANGYCIERIKGDNATVQVGELIGIKRGTNKHSWKWAIGAIRWMKFSTENNLQVGIEMMTPDAAAIGLRPSKSNEQYQRTLMLPALSAINQPATLLTGPVPWREGNQVTLNILGKEISITLKKALQNTGHFAQFLFHINDDSQAESSPKHNEWADDHDLDNVWSSI